MNKYRIITDKIIFNIKNLPLLENSFELLHQLYIILLAP